MIRALRSLFTGKPTIASAGRALAAFEAELDASLAQRKADRPAHQAAANRGFSASLKRRAEDARRVLGDFA